LDHLELSLKHHWPLDQILEFTQNPTEESCCAGTAKEARDAEEEVGLTHWKTHLRGHQDSGPLRVLCATSSFWTISSVL
jgi:hypothetical protein